MRSKGGRPDEPALPKTRGQTGGAAPVGVVSPARPHPTGLPMSPRSPILLAGAVALAFLAPAAHAERKRKPKAGPVPADPAASAADIPVLANLLEKTGWVPTPELSGGFKPGDIFAVTDQGHQWQGEGCFAAEARVSTYTATEVVAQLQVGVSTPLVGAEAGLHKKVKFGTPMHEALPGLGLTPTAACVQALQAAAQTHDLAEWYVVKEVLRAEITEQTCGRIDANGTFNPFVQMDASLSSSCAMGSLEPVAVAFRTISVETLFEASPTAPVAEPAPPPPDPSQFQNPGPYLVHAGGAELVRANTRRIRSAHTCGLKGAAMDSAKYVALAASDVPTVAVAELVVAGATRQPKLYAVAKASTKDKCFFNQTSFGVPFPEDLPATYDRVFKSTVGDIAWKAIDGLYRAPVQLPPGEYLVETSGKLYTFAVGE